MLVKHKPFAKKHPYRLWYVMIGIILIALAAYLLLPKSQAFSLTHQTNMTMALNSTASLMLPGDASVYVLYLEAVGNNSALVYLARQPILSNQILVLSLQTGKQAKINTYNGSATNLEITLLSSGANSARLSLIPVSTALGISPSSTSYFIQPSVLSNNLIYQNTTNVTVVTTSTTSTSTSVTTTVSSGNVIPTAQIMQEVNNSVFGILMNNYDTLYKKDVVCNQSVYNSTFIKYETTKPVGPFDFHNASLTTPTSLSSSMSYMKGKEYLVAYNSTAPSKRTTGVALLLTLNFSSGLITNSTFTGVYSGLNYSEVYKVYAFQSGINNFCGTYIPYVP